MTWQPPGHGAKGLRAKAVAEVRHPDDAATLMRELDAPVVQVSATWDGAQDAVDAVRVVSSKGRCRGKGAGTVDDGT